MLCSALACASHSEGDAPRSPNPAAPRCTDAALEAFEPGSAVRSRELLPPMRQVLQSQTMHVASVACEDDETDAACVDRARGEAGEQFPPPAQLTATVARAPNAWRLKLVVNGDERELTARTEDEVHAHVAGLRGAGHEVLLASVEPFATTDAPRSVSVRALTPATQTEHEALRLRLTLEPPRNDVAAMLRLRQRAAASALVIGSFEPQQGGAIVVHLSCRRPVAGASARPEAP